MSEHLQESNSEKDVQPTEQAKPEVQPEEKAQNTQDAQYTYRWSYEAQAAYDRRELARQRGKGARVYALVMCLAFAICLLVLGGTVWLSSMETPDRSLSAAEVAEIVNPGTVLIYAANNDTGGYGTGFFVRSNGYIATNYHIVEGMTKIQVETYAGEKRDATLKWHSAYDDLAILKIEGENYPILSIGSSSALKMGETAIAIGNPAGNLCPWTLTQGVVSAVNRTVTVEEGSMIIDLLMIQTDAQVNPGNSGGPLCNDRGEVIGIVARKMTDYEGLGLAIPIDGAMAMINAYLDTGSTDGMVSSVSRARPAIGIQVLDIKKGETVSGDYKAPENGVLVAAVDENGPGSGVLQEGDIILFMDGKRVEDGTALKELLFSYRPGDRATLTVDRYGERLTVNIRFS